MTAGRKVIADNKHWGTPKKYVDAVKKCFGGVINLDPCSNRFSIVRARVEYSLPSHDGLKESWNFPTIYVNPPYGNDREHGKTIKDWLRKCEEAHREYRAEVIALVPVATNTGHWKTYIYGQATSICFLYDTRLRFLENGKDEGKGAPMSCAMIYWGRDSSRFSEIFMPFGAVVNIENLKGIEIGQAHKKNKSQLDFGEFEIPKKSVAASNNI
jgi:DNA N-6-adenine-methyltransferase (Dam)